MASVATMGVYRRFAKLSDEEKQDVIKKVKEKMNIKDEGEATDEGGDMPSEMAPIEDIQKDEGNAESPDNPEGNETPSELAPVEDIKQEEQIEDGSGETGDTEAPSEMAPVEDIQQEGQEAPESQNELGDNFDSVEDEEEDDDTEDTTDMGDVTETEDTTDTGDDGEASSIVDDLAKEIQIIKQDGHVSPTEVVGLIKTMMEMVNMLLEAKPGRRRKKSSVREFIIAEKVIKGI